MEKIKVLTVMPAMCRCGYGEHSKEIIESLEQFNNVDIMTNLTNWGNCGWLIGGSYKERLIGYSNALSQWTALQPPKQPIDLVVHLSVPPEFEKRVDCPYVCVTAGIEADRIHPDWIVKINSNVDHLVVPSNFIKDVFMSTSITARDNITGQTTPLKINKPITVIPESVDTEIFNPNVECNLDINFDTDFNFITIGQWGNGNIGEERKNISLLVKWFKEAFKSEKNVGLVLKVNGVNNSLMDREYTCKKLEELKKVFKLSDLPKVYLIHDYLTENQLAQLYRHPKIKAYISLSHGEGWGRPMCEAAACDLPIMCLNWSGQKHFLDFGNFIKFKSTLTPVPPMHFGNLFVQGSNWASPDEQDTRRKMRKVVQNYLTPRDWAVDLGKKIRENFNKKVVYGMWKDFFLNNGYLHEAIESESLESTVSFD